MIRNDLLALLAALPLCGLAQGAPTNEPTDPATMNSTPTPPAAAPAAVYFTHDISPAGLEKAYRALGRPLEGRKVAVKISTGEAGNTHYLKPELIGPLVRSLQGDIVECNTAYGGSRQETPKHRQTIEDHGFNAIAKVVIMDEFDQIEIPAARARPVPAAAVLPPEDATEGDLLWRDVRGNVVNYDDWHSVSAEDVLVVDNVDPALRGFFITSLTNNLPRLRRAYARCVPSALAATNQTAVVRVFNSREEYLAYVGVEQKWTAALWSPVRRELVLYLPENGTEQLLRTVWHEAFHQYLAYAGSMIDSSPWFNEGHAQLFEHSHFDRTGAIVFDRDVQAAAYIQEFAAELAQNIPAVLEMDYTAFYDGTQSDVAAKYRLAWAMAYFLEVGAPQVRFRPFERLRADYLKALVRTRSMHEATAEVLNGERCEDFISAWLDFWKRQ